jgi:hypothetical protein
MEFSGPWKDLEYGEGEERQLEEWSAWLRLIGVSGDEAERRDGERYRVSGFCAEPEDVIEVRIEIDIYNGIRPIGDEAMQLRYFVYMGSSKILF